MRENHLYNRKGLLFEDSLWAFYLMRSLSHAVILQSVTYIYYSRPGSIMNEKYDERFQYLGLIHQEVANQLDPRKRKAEANRWLLNFRHTYIDAHENPDFQHAFDIYLRKMSDAGYYCAVCLLQGMRFMSRCSIGRWLFKATIKSRRFITIYTKRGVGRLLMRIK